MIYLPRIVCQEHVIRADSIQVVGPVDVAGELWCFEVCLLGGHRLCFTFDTEEDATEGRNTFIDNWSTATATLHK